MKRFRIPLILLGILVLYCLAMYFSKDIAIWIYGEAPAGCENNILTRTGQFGDSAGAINALFSALAFFGVLWTLIIQGQDSKIARFENTFFQMLSFQQEIVTGLTYSGMLKNKEDKFEKTTVHGRDVFYQLYQNVKLTENGKTFSGIKEFIQQYKKEEYVNISISGTFDHYFRHLYRIVRFINESKLPFKVCYQYTSMLRAQLSRFELVWLFYNCLSTNGNEKFKDLVEKYSLLKNIRLELLANAEDEELYNKKCEDRYIEQTTDFKEEYKRIAFVPEEQPKKKYRCILPLILDINIRIYRTLKK